MKKELRIKGDGHTQTLVFKEGASRCGGAVNGVAYYITEPFSQEYQPGGVMRNEDAALLMKALHEHLTTHAPGLL